MFFENIMTDISDMLTSGKLILRGKRWRKFHEFTLLPIVFFLVVTVSSILRINKIGYLENEMIPFIAFPIIFLIWWIPYKNRELKFTIFKTEKNAEDNYSDVLQALKILKWKIVKKNNQFIEAQNDVKMQFTSWGGHDMIFILIDDKRILITSLSDLDAVRNQSFFTFGRLTKNKNILIKVLSDLN